MAKIKTTQNDSGVDGFLAKIPAPEIRQDCAALIEIMGAATGCEPKMWGTSIVGFDTFHYQYADGKPGEICLIGFSPRKQNLVLYIGGNSEHDLLEKLGKFKTGKSCMYVNRLSDVDLPVLKQLIKRSVKLRRQTSQ
jgi:hypothetical protein